MGFGKKLTALVLAAAMTAAACSCGTESGKSTAGEESSQAEEKPDFRTEMRDDMTTGDIVAEMGLGINLGNTLEACGDWIDSSGGVNSYETAWGSPTVTEEMIAGYAAAGFDSVRIPVAWSNLMGDDYTVAPELLDRVETVAQYVLDNGMYAVVNLHWDNGWIAGFSTDYDTCMEKYTRIWEQVSERFSGYGDHLILESMNEEGCFDDLWNHYSGSEDGKAEAYSIVNRINQKFVDLVRSSGGNNPERHLLIAGYATDVDMTCDEMFQMPEDSAGRCAVSVHLLYAVYVLHPGRGRRLGQGKDHLGFAQRPADTGKGHGKAPDPFPGQRHPGHHRRIRLFHREQDRGRRPDIPHGGGTCGVFPWDVSHAVGHHRGVL